jgi:DNA repair exonuclease SbcCD ATPase subunit
MELLCIISFNNFKSLATLNTADTKKFLDQVLGFYTLTEYVDTCKRLKQETDNELNKINRQISNLAAQIQKLEELSNIELIDGNIEDTKNTINNLNQRLKDIDTEINKYIRERNEERASLAKKQSSVLTLGKNKKKEIEFIEKGTCPTCGAPIDQSQLEIKKKEKDLLLEQYNTFTEKINDIVKDMDKTVSEMNKQRRDPIITHLKDCEKLLTRLEEQAKRLNVNKEQIDKLQKDKESLSKTYDEYLSDSMSWDRLSNILSNDVRARILESFIPALNKNIMKYATELHQPYIVSFDNSFKCTISLCGYNEVIPISALSTGQLKTVDMMIILGVLGTVIGSSAANVIFLDELFSNLDGGLRNDMCSVLHNFISGDDTMFVISHQDLDERYFNGTIKLHLDCRGQFEKHSLVTVVPNENI